MKNLMKKLVTIIGAIGVCGIFMPEFSHAARPASNPNPNFSENNHSTAPVSDDDDYTNSSDEEEEEPIAEIAEAQKPFATITFHYDKRDLEKRLARKEMKLTGRESKEQLVAKINKAYNFGIPTKESDGISGIKIEPEEVGDGRYISETDDGKLLCNKQKGETQVYWVDLNIFNLAKWKDVFAYRNASILTSPYIRNYVQSSKIVCRNNKMLMLVTVEELHGLEQSPIHFPGIQSALGIANSCVLLSLFGRKDMGKRAILNLYDGYHNQLNESQKKEFNKTLSSYFSNINEFLKELGKGNAGLDHSIYYPVCCVYNWIFAFGDKRKFPQIPYSESINLPMDIFVFHAENGNGTQENPFSLISGFAFFPINNIGNFGNKKAFVLSADGHSRPLYFGQWFVELMNKHIVLQDRYAVEWALLFNDNGKLTTDWEKVLRNIKKGSKLIDLGFDEGTNINETMTDKYRKLYIKSLNERIDVEERTNIIRIFLMLLSKSKTVNHSINDTTNILYLNNVVEIMIYNVLGKALGKWSGILIDCQRFFETLKYIESLCNMNDGFSICFENIKGFEDRIKFLSIIEDQKAREIKFVEFINNMSAEDIPEFGRLLKKYFPNINWEDVLTKNLPHINWHAVFNPPATGASDDSEDDSDTND